MTSGGVASSGDDRFLFSQSPPDRAQWRRAGWVLAGLVVALLAAAPFARLPLGGAETLLPAYATAVLVNDLITAALLFSLFSVQRSWAILLLAVGYLFAALTVIPWALTFPGVFSERGLLDAGQQGTAAIAALRRLGFPLFALAYALLKDRSAGLPTLRRPARAVILPAVAAVAAAVCGTTWLLVQGDLALPRLMADSTRVAAAWRYVPIAGALLGLAALALLWARRRSVLDLWLMVALAASLIEIALLAYFSAGLRFSVGWWAGRLYGLASASVVLLVLLSEMTTLYGRLVRSVAVERRARDAQLAAMEALAASIAHEVNQPLAAMITNADAGLRWLDRPQPDLVETRAALQRIVGSGHRAGQVVQGIRSMFKKGPQPRESLDLNGLLGEVLRLTRGELEIARVTVELDLEPNLPRVTGSAVQLQQVILNLVTNSLEAMNAVFGRPRSLRLSTRLLGGGNLLLRVEDSGSGLDEALGERLFQPFVTTKADGMGMGLMISRSIVEAHGGQLVALGGQPAKPGGATFQFTLPVAGD